MTIRIIVFLPILAMLVTSIEPYLAILAFNTPTSDSFFEVSDITSDLISVGVTHSIPSVE